MGARLRRGHAHCRVRTRPGRRHHLLPAGAVRDCRRGASSQRGRCAAGRMETGQGGGDSGERHAHGESFVVQATPGIGKRASAWLCRTRRLGTARGRKRRAWPGCPWRCSAGCCAGSLHLPAGQRMPRI